MDFLAMWFFKPKRMDSGQSDRLSGLQDDLILHILSFVCLKDAIRTCVLSSKWRYMWTSIPRLSFSSEDFPTMYKFSVFVDRVFYYRNNQVQLSSIRFNLYGDDAHNVAQRMMNHAFSINVPQVNIACFYGPKILSLSRSQTLKHLTLRGSFTYDYITLTSVGTREFSSLTTLHLEHIILYDGFFSLCPNLENLTLSGCIIKGSNILRVCLPRLSKLTLDSTNFRVHAVNVVTPQLKDLIIWNCITQYQISAPELASLLIRGFYPSTFSTDGFPSLEKAQLRLHSLNLYSIPDASNIISLLQEFHNVKDLSLSMEIIQLLNSPSAMTLILNQPSPFTNLKSLKILPQRASPFTSHKRMRVVMSTEVKNYLLKGSPEATLIEVL